MASVVYDTDCVVYERFGYKPMYGIWNVPSCSGECGFCGDDGCGRDRVSAVYEKPAETEVRNSAKKRP